MVPMESLASPVPVERESQPQSHAVSGQDAVMSDQCAEASPLHSDPEDAPLICPSPPSQDADRSAPASFSPPTGPRIALPESSVPQITAPDPQVQYQVPHQLQVSPALFAQNQIQSSVSQPLPQLQVQLQVQVQPSVPQPQSSVNTSVHSSPLRVSVPQQQPEPTAAGLSKGGDDSAVQQHTQNSEFQ